MNDLQTDYNKKKIRVIAKGRKTYISITLEPLHFLPLTGKEILLFVHLQFCVLIRRQLTIERFTSIHTRILIVFLIVNVLIKTKWINRKEKGNSHVNTLNYLKKQLRNECYFNNYTARLLYPHSGITNDF